MTVLFKLCGSFLVIGACFFAGLIKSAGLRRRRARLRELCKGLSELRERIRMGGGEIEHLLKESFAPGLISFEEKPRVSDEWLEKRDTELLNAYLSEAGLSDAEGECRRAEMYLRLLGAQYDEAVKRCNELCRIYSAAGLLGGAVICIFFL